MKITQLFLVLALASPAVANSDRDEKRKQRQAEFEAFRAETPVADFTGGNSNGTDFTESVSLGGGYNQAGWLSVGQDPPLVAVLPTAAPTFSPSYIAAMQEAGTWEDPALEIAEGADAEKHKDKDKNKKDSKKYGGSGTGSKNPDCGGFCERYFQICEAANAFVNPDTPRGAPARRRLVRGDEPDINRLGESAFGSIDDCISACNGYPTPYDPLDYDFTSNQDMFSGGIELFGDTFWCRKYHLDLASDFRTDPYKVQVHCNAAQPSGGGICINSEIGVPLFDADDGETSPLNEINATVYELIRTGYETARHLGYCQLYFHDIVADCTKGGIDDVTLPVALALLPGTVEVIILNNNVGFNGDDPTSGITRFDDGTFNNLLCPTCIRALICDQGNLATIAAGAFAPLINLEMLSLNTNPIKAIPAGMLDPLPLLRELSIANDESFPGRLNSTTIPSNLLFRNPRMRKLTITGHKALSALSISFFKNVNSDLSEMEIIDLSNNGLTNNGDAPTNLPAGMFNNMGKLQYLDLSSNQLTKGDAGWFSAGWGFELRVLKLHNNVITTFEKGIFDTLEKLETVFMHDNDGIIGASIGAFKNNPNLITYTVGKKP